MSYVQGEDRGQAALLPAAIEDYVAADTQVRVIDAFVDGLDVRGLGFGRSMPAMTGRPPYDPRDLLKLYLYGCWPTSPISFSRILFAATMELGGRGDR
jgi:transposase